MQGLSCGTSRIVGCRFSIYPMTDNFIEIILKALKEVDYQLGFLNLFGKEF